MAEAQQPQRTFVVATLATAAVVGTFVLQLMEAIR